MFYVNISHYVGELVHQSFGRRWRSWEYSGYSRQILCSHHEPVYLTLISWKDHECLLIHNAQVPVLSWRSHSSQMIPLAAYHWARETLWKMERSTRQGWLPASFEEVILGLPALVNQMSSANPVTKAWSSEIL